MPGLGRARYGRRTEAQRRGWLWTESVSSRLRAAECLSRVWMRLGRAAAFEEVRNGAVVAASDWVRSVTAAIVTARCGALVDQ